MPPLADTVGSSALVLSHTDGGMHKTGHALASSVPLGKLGLFITGYDGIYQVGRLAGGYRGVIATASTWQVVWFVAVVLTRPTAGFHVPPALHKLTVV